MSYSKLLKKTVPVLSAVTLITQSILPLYAEEPDYVITPETQDNVVLSQDYDKVTIESENDAAVQNKDITINGNASAIMVNTNYPFVDVNNVNITVNGNVDGVISQTDETNTIKVNGDTQLVSSIGTNIEIAGNIGPDDMDFLNHSLCNSSLYTHSLNNRIGPTVIQVGNNVNVETLDTEGSEISIGNNLQANEVTLSDTILQVGQNVTMTNNFTECPIHYSVENGIDSSSIDINNSTMLVKGNVTYDPSSLNENSNLSILNGQFIIENQNKEDTALSVISGQHEAINITYSPSGKSFFYVDGNVKATTDNDIVMNISPRIMWGSLGEELPENTSQGTDVIINGDLSLENNQTNPFLITGLSISNSDNNKYIFDGEISLKKQEGSSAKSTLFYFPDPPSQNILDQISVWGIDTNVDYLFRYDSCYSPEEAKNLGITDSIHYILHHNVTSDNNCDLSQEQANLRIEKEDGSLANTKSAGYDKYSKTVTTAHASETMYITPISKDGYEVKIRSTDYQNGDTVFYLSKDEQGRFLYTIPDWGYANIEVIYSLLPIISQSISTIENQNVSNTQQSQPQQETYSEWVSNTIIKHSKQHIVNNKSGYSGFGTVESPAITENTIVVKSDICGSFNYEALEKLSFLPQDIEISFPYKEHLYQFTIPKNTNLLPYQNEEGYAGFLYLSEIFGRKEISLQ